MSITSLNCEEREPQYVLQLCHGYGMPFHDVARQYVTLFSGTDYRVITVFITGEKNGEIADYIGSDKTIFLENSSKDIRGLKRKQIKQVSEICKKYNFAFCIGHRFKSVYIAAHIPNLFVIGVHHAFGDYERWHRKLFVLRHKRNIALLGVSNAVCDDIRKKLFWFPEKQVQTLYNRINVEGCRNNLVSKEEARKKLNLPENAYVFGNVGRLHPDKDQATLLKAFALASGFIPNCLLVIVGKGRLENELKNLAEKLGISEKVIFTGVVENASCYFNAFDSFLLSSDHEPFGMVLLEAMVAGLPMLVCNSGGAPEIVSSSDCLFSLGNEVELAEKMRKTYLLNNDELTLLKESMSSRLIELFSDDAVRKCFWNVGFVKKLIG